MGEWVNHCPFDCEWLLQLLIKIKQNIRKVWIIYHTCVMANSDWFYVVLLQGVCTGIVILLISRGKSSHLLVFSEDLFFIYLLPPIIFNAGCVFCPVYIFVWQVHAIMWWLVSPWYIVDDCFAFTISVQSSAQVFLFSRCAYYYAIFFVCSFKSIKFIGS